MSNIPWSKKSNKERVDRLLDIFDKPRLSSQLIDPTYIAGYNDGVSNVVTGIRTVLEDWNDD